MDFLLALKPEVYISVAVDNFSELGWGLLFPLKKNMQNQKPTYRTIFSFPQKENSNELKLMMGKVLTTIVFTGCNIERKLKRCSRYRCKRAVFAERFNRTIKNSLQVPIF